MGESIRKNSNPLRLTAGIFLALLLAAIVVSPRPILNKEKPTLDAASYLAHAFTIGLDFDLDYSNEPYDRRGYFNERTQLPGHPIGPGLLAAPFVAIFSVVDRMTDNPVIDDHNDFIYSWSRFGFFFGGIVYFFLGLLFYRDVARRIAPTFRPAWLLVAGFGSGVGYYAFQSGYLGHQFEFFCLALVVWSSTVAWQAASEGKKYLGYLFIGAIAVALGHLVRPANLNIVLLPMITLLALTLFFRVSARDASFLRRLLVEHLVVLSVALLGLGIVYGVLYGTPFPLPSDMYGGRAGVEEISSAAPGGFDTVLSMVQKIVANMYYIPSILLGSEFGLLYTCSIMVFGVVALLVGIAAEIREHRHLSLILLLLVFLYVGIPGAVVLYWETTASAYGWRYLFSVIAIGYLGVLSMHAYSTQSNKLIWWKPFIVALLILSVFGILAQAFWGSSSKLHYNAGPNVFGRMHGKENCCSGIGYTTNLVEELAKPQAWIDMSAHRFPGYAGFELLKQLNVDVSKLGKDFGLPADKLEAGLARYANVPIAASVQILLVFFFSAGAVLLIGSSSSRQRNQHEPE